MLQTLHPSTLRGLHIVLASASPRRRLLLEQMVTTKGVPFRSCPSTFAEDLDKTPLNPTEYVRATAAGKAKEVFTRLKVSKENVDLVISADTIVVAHDDDILEKPKDTRHALEMLLKLNNASHRVITAVCFAHGDRGAPVIHTFHEETRVTFADNSREKLMAYIGTGAPMDKAGGYGIQDATGGTLIKGISGDFYNVMGFPVHQFSVELEKWLLLRGLE